ncbi:conserved hypothetical protein [Gammaproteobacteria bacterium]
MNTLHLEYENDFYGWIYKNIELLKKRQFAEIDIDILIDELENMAKRDKRELISRFTILIAHLLKWQFQSEQRGGSWQSSIDEQRFKIDKHLEDSPSLKSQITESIKIAYPDARKLAIKETKLASKIFPSECLYSIDQLLDENFYPN